METVCLTCGDIGFPETLVSCKECQACTLHRYCLDGPVIFTGEVTWFCEDCETKPVEPSSLGQSVPVSSETSDFTSLAKDAIKARRELGNCINKVKKSNLLPHEMIKEEKQKKMKVGNPQQQKMKENEQNKRNVSDQQQQKMIEEEKEKKKEVSNQQQKMIEEEKEKKKEVSNQQQKMSEEEKQKKKEVSVQQQQNMIEEEKQKKRKVSDQQQQKKIDEEKQKKKVSDQQQQKMVEEEEQKKSEVIPGLVARTKAPLSNGHSLPQLEHTQCSNSCEDLSKIKNDHGPLPIDAADSLIQSESVPVSLPATNDDSNCVELDHHAVAQPVTNPIWRGSFNFCNKTIGRVTGLLAHMSSLACPKVQHETELFPELLRADLLPSSTVWPKSFKKGGPTDQSIALYIFPESEIHEKAFDKLLGDIIQHKHAIRVVTENAELLVFPSTALPVKHWRFQAKYYMWGVFRRKQTTSHKT